MVVAGVHHPFVRPMTVRAYKTDVYEECGSGIEFVFCTPQRKSKIFYQMCKSAAESFDGGMNTSDFIKECSPKIWREPKMDPAAEHFGEYFPFYEDGIDDAIGQWLFEKGMIVFYTYAEDEESKIDTTIRDFKHGTECYEGWFWYA